MRVCLLFLTALLALPSLAFAHGKVRTEDFASDRNWRVYSEVPSSATRQGPTFLGKAQRVCLNATAPTPDVLPTPLSTAGPARPAGRRISPRFRTHAGSGRPA